MDGVNETATAANAMPNAPPPFLSKTYDMVDDQATDAVVSWSTSNNSFIVWNVPEFSRDILPKYFKHSNFSSFVRQLNTYGFRKVDPDCFEFANEGFLRGQKHLLKSISRRKFTHVQSHQQPSQAQSPSVGLCVEVGKFGLEEEVEKLKMYKNVLMQELVKLRQQQQATDQQLNTVGHRVQVMEQRQQQMMSFLAKAVHSPGFLSQLVHQQNESNRRISGVNKKRRLPNQEEENLGGKHDMASPDGQIIKFQPLINEAAKAMLRQILKMNAASRLESTISNRSGFLIDSVPSSDVLDSGSSSNEIPAVTLSEVISTSLQSHMSEDPGFCRNHPAASISKIQSPPGAVSSNLKTVPETGMLNSLNDTVLPDITQLQKVIPETTVGVRDTRSKGSESRDIRLMDQVSEFLDGSMACINHPAASIFKSQSTPGAVSSNHRTAVPETGMLNSLNDTVLPDITQLQVVPDSRSKGSESQDMHLMDSVSEFLDGSMAITLDEFSADADMLLDGIPKLPGINDVFWEQFLSAGPLMGDTDEVCVSSTGSISNQELQTGQESAWDKTKNMNHLTEQMGLLASGSKRM